MADIKILAPFILSYEGGFVNDPLDRGGATNMGVTISTWKRVGYDKDGDGDIDVDDLRRLTREDVVERVLRPHYWNRWQANLIVSQSIANTLVDWVWASGINGIKIPQRLLGVTADGIVGPKTLQALNSRDSRKFFEQIQSERRAFVENIVKRDPSQRRFLGGWLRRIDAIRFGSLVLNTVPEKTITFNDK